MGKMKQFLIVPAAILILVTLYLVFRVVSSSMQGYSWQEMDWQQRGSTSLWDFLKASDIGKREITQDVKKCVEYFSYKDGLPIKTVCRKQ